MDRTVGDVIRPAIQAGKLVIADRFFLSTYAYQVAGRGLAEEEIRSTNGNFTLRIPKEVVRIS